MISSKLASISRPRLADTHCHLDFECFDSERPKILRRCIHEGVELIVVPSVAQRCWASVRAIGLEYQTVRVAYGMHPHFLSEHEEVHLQALSGLLSSAGKVCVAVGEIGLDAYVDNFDRQLYFFRQQLQLARQHKLPVIIHSRKTHNEVYRELRRQLISSGVIHAFSGSLHEAERYAALGFKLGVGAIVTWSRATKTRNTFAALPLDALVLETDAPDMAVAGKHKGKGLPYDVRAVFAALCEIRPESPTELANALWQNSVSLFGLD